MKTPTPERARVLLVRDGSGPFRATPHEYVRTELVDVLPIRPRRRRFDDDDRKLDVTEREPSKGYAFVFRCTETGAERRYGLEQLGECREAGVVK